MVNNEVYKPMVVAPSVSDTVQPEDRAALQKIKIIDGELQHNGGCVARGSRGALFR